MSSPETDPKTGRPWWITVAALAALALIGVLARHRPPPSVASQTPIDAGPAEAVPRTTPTLRVPTPVKGAGPETLSGTVVDVAGEPVPSAEIIAEFELGPGVKSMDTGGLGKTPVVTAVSAADGAFALVGLEAGRYRIRVRAPGIYTAEVRFVEVPGQSLRIVVAREVAVRGLVVDAGMPVAGARVSIVGDGIVGQLSTVSNAKGDFAFTDLAEGQFQVWAVSGDKGTAAKRVRRLGKGPFGSVVLELGDAGVVSGKVVDQTSEAGVVAAIRLTAVGHDEPPRFGRSDGTGAFRIEGVPLGRYRAEAYAPGYVSAEAVTFDVGKSYEPILELVRAGIVSGTVVTQDGRPVEDAAVSLRRVGKAGTSTTIDQASRAEAAALRTGMGQRSSLGVGQRFVPVGELGVLLGPIPFPPPRGASAVRVAHIVDVRRRGGRVSSDAGVPTADTPLPVTPGLESTFTSDGQGAFRIAGLAPGRYHVVVTHRDYADGLSEPVTVSLGKHVSGVKVVLVPGVVIVGTVSDNHGDVVVGATVTATAKGDTELRLMAATGTDGAYRLGPIAVNVSMHVKAVGYGTTSRAVKVGAPRLSVQTRTEDFVLVKADAVLSGTVEDGAGFPLPKAVVAIDDKGLSARPRSATTDDKGQFSIDKLAPGSYPVTVSHPDFPPAKGKAKTGAEASLSVPFGGGIQLEVIDKHTRAALAGARVIATGPAKVKRTSAADDKGLVTFVPVVAGKWTLTVDTAGYVGATRTVSVAAGTKPKEITSRDHRFELERGATVAGTVRDANGVRVRGATVTVGTSKTKTDENGRFRMIDVPTSDQARVEAVRKDARGHIEVPLRPGDELVTLEITIR